MLEKSQTSNLPTAAYGRNSLFAVDCDTNDSTRWRLRHSRTADRSPADEESVREFHVLDVELTLNYHNDGGPNLDMLLRKVGDPTGYRLKY